MLVLKQDPILLAFSIEGRGHEPRKVRNTALKAGKGEEIDSLIKPPEGSTDC